MDPAKEIAELKAKRDALEQQLAAPGIDKDERIAINQRIVAVTGEITMWGGHVTEPFSRWLAFQDGFWNGGGSLAAGFVTAGVGAGLGLPWPQAKMAGFCVGIIKFFVGMEGYRKWPRGTWPKPKL